MKDNEIRTIKNNTISKNEGGIDLSRVLNKDYLLSLGDFYKCSICSKIMVNPIDCESCGHSFCNECISKSKCPFGCEKKSFKPSSMGIKNLLINLKFKCPNEGCKEIISYIDVKAHDNICPFQKLICPNRDCEEQLLKKDLENHIKNVCEYTMIKCSYCNYKFPRCQIAEHEKMCSVAYQSFNSSSGNILNLSNNNTNNQIDNGKNETKNYAQALYENIDKVLKDNKILNTFNNNNNNDNNNNNNYNENNINNNNNNIIDNNINNNTENSNLNNIIKNNNNNVNNNIFNRNSSNNSLKNNNIFNENENNNNQNENIENNNELSRLSLRQSLAQIEEDDLIDILKKAIEEKLSEKFVIFDSNFDKLIKELKIIKTFVCKTNTMDEIKDNEEEENDDEDNKYNKSNKNKNANIILKEYDNKLNNLKDYLKEIVDKAEKEINQSINNLNIEINKEISESKNIKIDKDKNNKDNEIIINDINNKLDEITNKINNNINETNKVINNINLNIQNGIVKILPEKVKDIKIKEEKDTNINNNEKIIKDLENIFKNIIENNNKEYNDKIIKIIDEKINNINKEKDINENKDKENNEKIKNEINNNINEKFNSMNKDINNVSEELKTIKTNIKDITTL